ncbi:hypothetical protein G7Y89_g9108 [Cudoniella acicularis]|uniref:Nucleoside phosphorylase domain-containing protein n=1 Tax=Cudoniella acicularis TaxID=354080 RepID=A0A8H4W280_9HELO|nr:hypothetical protein G7Y89_g9108 [Cudoniella acicularis]
MHPTPHLPPDQYTVGWICTHPLALHAARALLTTTHTKLTHQPKNDKNTYTLGRISPHHNVVITCISQSGTVPVAVAATSMQSTFKWLRFGLLVGIGGGIPSVKNDIRLGDVVVSRPTGQGAGVVQYDSGKSCVGGFERIGTLDKPPLLLRSAMTSLMATRGVGREILELVEEALGDEGGDESSENGWIRPSSVPGDVVLTTGAGLKDVLFKADAEHLGSNLTCGECEERDPQSVISRKPRKTPHPRVFYGNIGSGNSVMKNAVQRDALAKRDDILCFETAAAGLMDVFPCLVIQGVCGYADSHQNKDWQSYSAAVASGYAKRLLAEISSEEVESLETIKKKNESYWVVPRVVNPDNTGMRTILETLRQKLYLGTLQERARFRYSLITKIEKGIFWIDAQDEDSIRKSIVEAAKTASEEEKEVDYKSARRWFENQNKSWLLILDNAENTNLNYLEFFPSGDSGCVIITTRGSEYQQYNTASQQDAEFEKLGVEDLVELLLESAQAS